MSSNENSSLTCWGRLPISAKLMLPLSALHLISGIVLLASTGIFGSSTYASLFGGEVIFFGVFGALLLLVLSVLGCLNAFDQERRHRWSITHVIMSAVIMFSFFVLMAYVVRINRLINLVKDDVGTLADLTKEKINPPYNDRILFYDPATPRMLRTMMGVMMSACDLRISNLSVTEYASTYVASCANEDLGYFADFVNLGKGNYSGCLGADHPIPHNTTESSYWKCYTSEAIGGSGDDTVAASIDTTSGLFCQCFTAFSDVAFEWTWPVQYMGQVVFALTIVMCILSLYVAYYSGTELEAVVDFVAERQENDVYAQRSLLHGVALLFRTKGSVLPRLMPLSVIAGVLAYTSKNLIAATTDGFGSIFTQPYAHQIFALSVAFGLISRINLAYERWWEARGYMTEYFSKLEDAIGHCIVFDYGVSGDLLRDADEFREQLVHYASLLSACVIQTLQQEQDLDAVVKVRPKFLKTPRRTFSEGVRRTPVPIEVLGGLTAHERELLHADPDRPSTIHGWLVRCITVRQREGGLTIPPPILTRVYQELSVGMMGYHGANKIAQVPFPYAVAQLNWVQLAALTLTAPFVIAAFTNSANLAAILSALTVGGFQGISEVAWELESPFVSRSNELPLHIMQDRFNRRMESVLRPAFMAYNYQMRAEEHEDEDARASQQQQQLLQKTEPAQIHSAVQRRMTVTLSQKHLPIGSLAVGGDDSGRGGGGGGGAPANGGGGAAAAGGRLEHAGSFGARGHEPGRFEMPTFVASLPSGDLVVADTGNHRLQVVAPDGSARRTIGGRGTSAGQLKYPRGVAIDGGNVFVADSFNNRVSKFELATGALLGTVGTIGHGDGQLKFPLGLAIAQVGAQKRLYVADEKNHRVCAFSLELEFLFAFGAKGGAPGEFLHPCSVAAHGGELLVAEGGNHRVQASGAAGTERHTTGAGGSGGSGMRTSKTSGDGEEKGSGLHNLHNHRIQAFSFDGDYLRPVCGKGAEAGQVSFPYGLASVGGQLLVSEHTGARMQLLSSRGECLQAVASPGESRLGGVCTHGSRVYAVDAEQHKVHVYTLQPS